MTVEELEIVIRANVNDALKGIKTVVEAVKLATEESVAPMQQIAAQSRAIGNQTVSSMQQSKSAIRGLGKEIQATTAQQELLLNKINDLKATLTLAEQDPKLFSKSEVLDMRAEVERLEKQLINLQGTSKTTENQFEKTFNKGIKSAKRFGVMLLGARSMFLLFRKGMQSAIQTEEGLAAQNEVTSNILGQLFVPAMKMALNVVQYLMIGMALLIKMFTGYDALAKVTTKNMNKAAKATKGLTKELTAMDEITNLSEDGVGLGLDVAADLNALEEFTKKIEEVEKLFAEWNAKSFVDSLKDVWKWLVENKNMIVLVGGAIAVAFATKKIFDFIGVLSTLGGAFKLATGAMTIVSGSPVLLGLGLIAGAIWVITKAWQDAEKAYGKYSDATGKGGNFSSGGGSGGGGGGGGRFATGGVVTKPFVGLVGEYPDAKSNPEIISPQSIMRDTLIEALQSVQSTQSNNSNVVLNINGRELAKAIQSDLNYESNRMGTSTAIRRV